MPEFPETYLGDGVYASFDGYQVWLRAERDGQTHKIALEREVIEALVHFDGELRTPTEPVVDPTPQNDLSVQEIKTPEPS